MAQSAELQPSFQDVFNILSQAPAEKLLSLKLKLKLSIPGPCSKLLQAMVLLTLGQETDARICLDALRDNRAAQYVQQIKLGTAGVQEDRENLQPPQLDAGAVALLAQVYTVLAQEKLCSPEARDKACQAATKACHTSKDTQQGTLNNIPPKKQDKQDSAASRGSGDRFSMLRSREDAGFPHTASSHYVERTSPVQIGGNSDLSGPRTLCSVGSFSLSSSLEISTSPTVAFHSQPSVPECVPQPSCAGHPEGDTQSHGLQESSWASTASSPPGQDTAAQGPQPEQVLQLSPCHPSPLPVPETPLPSEPAQSSDVSSTVTEPHTPREKQDEKQFSTGVPDPRAAVDTAPAHMPTEDSNIPKGIPSNSAPASISTCSLPPTTYSFSTLPPLQESHSSLFYPPPLRSSPSPAWSPALPAVDPSEPDGAKFFTFVVLHASEDEIVAHQLKTLLEKMGVSNGATLSEDFFIPGRSHMTCFQEAMENSAFMILLLTKNFPCKLCLFQTDTALMQSILDPSKQDSVIPFLPKANALERSQIPMTLSVLITLDESSPLFSRNVHKTFNPKKIMEKKALWYQMQRRKLQACLERQQAQQNLAALSLGSPPWVPPTAPRPRPAEPPAQLWCPPAPVNPPFAPVNPPFAPVNPPPAPWGPPPAQAQLPPGHYSITPGQGGIPPLIIQHARMVQIGNHNVMQVETAPPEPRDSQEQTRHNV